MKFAAFLSYARTDDNNGRVTRLRRAIEEELRQVGINTPVFMDVEDIRCGEEWKARVSAALHEAATLIPVLTPNYLHSKECAEEVRNFLEQEEQRDERGIIMPIAYAPVVELSDEAKLRAASPEEQRLAEALLKLEIHPIQLFASGDAGQGDEATSQLKRFTAA